MNLPEVTLTSSTDPRRSFRISHDLKASDMLYLEAGKPHAVEAIKDSSELVIVLLNKK